VTLRWTRVGQRFTRDVSQQGRQDSNLQPPVLETGALPIELLPWAPRANGSPVTLALVHRRALGILFAALSASLLAIAVFSALEGGRAWVVALAAGALGVWMGDLARRALTPRR
jgi:hypothetical protein